MAYKNFTQDPRINELMNVIAEAPGMPDEAAAALNEVSQLPADARLFCANALETRFMLEICNNSASDIAEMRATADILDAAVKTGGLLSGASSVAAKGALVAAKIVSTIHDTKGKQTCITVRKLAQNMASIPEIDPAAPQKLIRLLANAAEEAQALAKKHDKLLQQLFSPSDGGATFRSPDVQNLTPTDRAFVADTIEAMLHSMQMMLEEEGFDAVRAADIPGEDNLIRIVSAEMLRFVIDVKGDGASPLVTCLAELIGRGKQDANTKPQNIFCDACEMAAEWPEIQKARAAAKLAVEQGQAATGQVNRDIETLKNLRPPKPSLKPSK